MQDQGYYIQSGRDIPETKSKDTLLKIKYYTHLADSPFLSLNALNGLNCPVYF